MSRTVQERIDAYWSDRAPSYDAVQLARELDEGDHRVWSRVWSGALPPPPCDVLDLGTGTGVVACLLASLGHRVTGIDRAQGMLEAARTNAAVQVPAPTILEGDMVAPDFADDSFDVVTGRYVMWTLREPLAAIAAWCRVLRPGGLVAMVDSPWFPRGVPVDGEVVQHGMRQWYDDEVLAALPVAEARTIDDTAEVMREAGLRDVTVTPLTELLELDRRRGAAPGHVVQTQYLLTGTAPEGPAA